MIKKFLAQIGISIEAKIERHDMELVVKPIVQSLHNDVGDDIGVSNS